MVPMDVVTNQAGPSAEPEDGDGIMAFLFDALAFDQLVTCAVSLGQLKIAGSGCRA